MFGVCRCVGLGKYYGILGTDTNLIMQVVRVSQCAGGLQAALSVSDTSRGLKVPYKDRKYKREKQIYKHIY